MREPTPILLLSLSALIAGCGAVQSPKPAKKLAERRCSFLEPGGHASRRTCPIDAFIQDQVDLLVESLERDASWGALISPELAKEKQLVIVANVSPALRHFRDWTAGKVSDEVHRMVQSIQKRLENELLRRSLKVTLPDGSERTAVFLGGQLRGTELNDYMAYLEQSAQTEGSEPLFIPHDSVKLRARAARTGLLWTVSAVPVGPSVEVEFRIKTFEMELDEKGQGLVVRGQLADRTAQLLRIIHSSWTKDSVGPPPVRVATSLPRPDPEPLPPPQELQPEPKEEVEYALRVGVVRLTLTEDRAYAVDIGRGPLPRNGDRFAILLFNDHEESVSYLFGADEPAVLGMSLPIAGARSDRSIVYGAPEARMATALGSFFDRRRGEEQYLLVLRRRDHWTLAEQGRDRWTCKPSSTFAFETIPVAPVRLTEQVWQWLQVAVSKHLRQANPTVSKVPELGSVIDLAGIPSLRIPVQGSSEPLCLVLRFGPQDSEGGFRNGFSIQKNASLRGRPLARSGPRR